MVRGDFEEDAASSGDTDNIASLSRRLDAVTAEVAQVCKLSRHAESREHCRSSRGK